MRHYPCIIKYFSSHFVNCNKQREKLCASSSKERYFTGWERDSMSANMPDVTFPRNYILDYTNTVIITTFPIPTLNIDYAGNGRRDIVLLINETFILNTGTRGADAASSHLYSVSRTTVVCVFLRVRTFFIGATRKPPSHDSFS